MKRFLSYAHFHHTFPDNNLFIKDSVKPYDSRPDAIKRCDRCGRRELEFLQGLSYDNQYPRA